MDLLLIKYASEIFLKGQNRNRFEKKLKDNIKNVLEGEEYTFHKDQNRWFIDAVNLEQVKEKVKKVFGVYEVCIVRKVERDLDLINEAALEVMTGYKEGTTFKVVTKRADKTFPLTSMETSMKVGGHILRNTTGYEVEIRTPDVFIEIEIREKAYVYMKKERAIGGMPYGVSGSTMLMLSGGIDSPVAGFLMAKRGIQVHGIYFHSHPYTSERAKDKVKDLAKIISSYTGEMILHVVPFTEIQMEIMEKCPESELTIIMRRFMMRCSCALAEKLQIPSVTTGESVGQVASQTMEALVVTDDVSDRPVFRPLVAMDKGDIIALSHEMGAFETSILPYEDCCTIFVPKHPLTNPKLKYIQQHEEVLDIDGLVERAINGEEVFRL